VSNDEVKTPIVEDESTLQLIAAAQSGDLRSLRLILSQYTPLLHSTVERYSRGDQFRDSHTNELLQIGQSAMTRAILDFVPSRGKRLATVVIVYIRNAVLKQVEWQDNYQRRFTNMPSDDIVDTKAFSTTTAPDSSITFTQLLALLPEDQRFALEALANGESVSGLTEYAPKHSRYKWEHITSEAIENIKEIRRLVADVVGGINRNKSLADYQTIERDTESNSEKGDLE